MRDVFIAGTGMTAFGKFMDSSVRKLAEEATSPLFRAYYERIARQYNDHAMGVRAPGSPD